VSETDTEITICADGSLCCGLRNTNCCGSSLGVWLINGSVYEHDATPTPRNSTIPRTTSRGSKPSAGSSTWEASAVKETAGASGVAAHWRKPQKIALGVGLGVGLSILLILLGIVVFTNRKSRKLTAETKVNSAPVDPFPSGILDVEQPYAELHNEDKKELDVVERSLHELDGKEKEESLNELDGKEKQGREKLSR
jgi:hypothetical protein